MCRDRPSWSEDASIGRTASCALGGAARMTLDLVGAPGCIPAPPGTYRTHGCLHHQQSVLLAGAGAVLVPVRAFSYRATGIQRRNGIHQNGQAALSGSATPAWLQWLSSPARKRLRFQTSRV